MILFHAKLMWKTAKYTMFSLTHTFTHAHLQIFIMNPKKQTYCEFMSLHLR